MAHSQGTDKLYSDWIDLIAKTNSKEELLEHFRDHVYNHIHHHNGEGEFGLKIWITGIYNFVDIFKKKFGEPDTEDQLLQMAVYYLEKHKGPEPPFDLDKFMNSCNTKTKDYYLKRNRLKK